MRNILGTRMVMQKPDDTWIWSLDVTGVVDWVACVAKDVLEKPAWEAYWGVWAPIEPEKTPNVSLHGKNWEFDVI